MAYEVVNDLSADTTIAIGGRDSKTDKLNPTQIEGYYLGQRQVQNKDGTNSTVHFFQTPEGNIGVWGKADSNRKLAVVPVGRMTLVKFENKVKTAKGTMMYKYSVASDPDNTIDVGTMAGATTKKPSVALDEDDNTVDTESYSSSDADREEELQNQALAAAERKAKVQALLAGKAKRN